MNFVFLGLVVLLAVIAVFASKDNSCSSDITAATQAISDASLEIQDVMDNCDVKNYNYECAKEWSKLLNNVILASDAITKAISDCGGEDNACADDINMCVASGAKATEAIMYAVLDCRGKNSTRGDDACRNDVKEASVQIAAFSVAIAKANEDCNTDDGSTDDVYHA